MSSNRVLTNTGYLVLGAFVMVCAIVAAYAWCWIAQEATAVVAGYFG